MKVVLLFGGSGYIGTAVTESLLQKGFRVVNFDKNPPKSEFFEDGKEYTHLYHNLVTDPEGPIRNEIEESIEGGEVVGAIHFAAYKSLPESDKNAYAYYKNNLNSLLNALAIFNQHRSPNSKFIFSSSAAVYDVKSYDGNPVDEKYKIECNNPYRNTKIFGELILKDVARQYRFEALSLRYFNPIGCTELSKDTTASMFSNIRKAIETDSVFKVFGNDYNTRDGSCIRDFIDIHDLADAHVYFLELIHNSYYDEINIGTGTGTTVLEVVNTVKELYPEFKYTIEGRREGDLAGVFADTKKMEKAGFRTRRTFKDSISSLKLGK